MSAPKIFQGYLAPAKAKLLSVYHKTQIAANQDDAELGRVIVPFGCRLLRVDYDLTVAGSSGTVTDLKVVTGSSTISEVLAPAAGAGQKTGSIDITTPEALDYAEGTVFKVTADTSATNTTIDSVALTFVFIPTVP